MTTTTIPSAAVALPVSHLQLLRVRTLAHAALRRLSLARSEAYWESPVGRERMNAMWCGEQDGICAEREDIRRGIEEEEAVAQSIADAIVSAGCFLIDGKSDSRADRALADIGVVREFAAPAYIGEPYDRYWKDTETRLREFLTA